MGKKNTIQMQRADGKGGYAETTQQAFDEVWSAKGYVIVGGGTSRLPTPEELQALEEKQGDTEEDQPNQQEEPDATVHAQGDDEDLLRPRDR